MSNPEPTNAAAHAGTDLDRLLDFWRQAGPAKWFAKDAAFDDAFREAFADLHDAAKDGRLDDWADSANGALGLILLLDQWPRNVYRGDPRSFATDDVARNFADKAIDAGYDLEVAPELRSFFYLPFMHCEDIGVQDRCVALCEEMGEPNTVKYARLHRDIIARFQRFPHRNAVLGRQSTEEELAFLESGGFAG